MNALFEACTAAYSAADLNATDTSVVLDGPWMLTYTSVVLDGPWMLTYTSVVLDGPWMVTYTSVVLDVS